MRILIALFFETSLFAVEKPSHLKSDTKNNPPNIKQASRVITCSLSFPLDSVRIEPSKIKECFKPSKIDNISYVHVIATASTDGSTGHNLYLSNRRAGAVETFINDLFPNLNVHAFGGGENPKFGKAARIFIVENLPSKTAADGPQVASISTSKVTNPMSTKPPLPTKNLEYSIHAGRSQLNDGALYDRFGISVFSKFREIPYIKGLRTTFSQHSSNYHADILRMDIEGVFSQTIETNFDFPRSLEFSLGPKISTAKSLSFTSDVGLFLRLSSDVEFLNIGLNVEKTAFTTSHYLDFALNI